MNEYIKNLDRKNFILLILSVIIMAFMAFYYLHNYFYNKKIKLQNQKIEILKKIRQINLAKKELISLKNQNKILKTKLYNLKKDLKYLLSEIESSDVLNVDKEHFLKILHNMITSGANINASFLIKENKPLKKYLVFIKGSCSLDKYFNFVEFIKTIEANKAIIEINNFKAFRDKKNINYNLDVLIWSFK